MAKTNTKKKNKGFTLIELLAVVAILVALVAVLLPLVFSIIDKAKIARAGVDMFEITNGALAHVGDTGNMFRVGTSVDDATEPSAPVTCAYTSLVTNFGGDDGIEWLVPPTWSGPYIEHTRCVSPWGSEYGMATTINLSSDCGTDLSSDYERVVRIDLSGVAPARKRQRVSVELDKAFDGVVNGDEGKVRYPIGYTYVCIGIGRIAG